MIIVLTEMTFTPDWSFNIEYICAAILSILHICINLHSPELQCQLTRKQNMLTNNDTTNNDKQEGQKEKERKKEERVLSLVPRPIILILQRL